MPLDTGLWIPVCTGMTIVPGSSSPEGMMNKRNARPLAG